MIKKTGIRFISLLSAVIVLVSFASVSYAGAGEILTLDKAIDYADEYSRLGEMQEKLQRGWHDELEIAKGNANALGELIEVDDKVRKIKKYLDEEDYRSMRIDVVREDAVDFLVLYGYITYLDYLLVKGGLTEDDVPIMYIFNDDEILKKYYEFQLKYLPEALPEESRLELLTRGKTGAAQAEAAIKQEKVKLEAEREKLRIDVIKAYTDCIMAQKSLNNANNNLEETTKVTNKYKVLMNSGKISGIEYKKANAELESMKNESEKAERQFDKCKTILNVLTGRYINSSAPVDENIEINDKPYLSYSGLAKQMENENINLYLLRETRLNPALTRYEAACEELKPEDKLYKDIQDEKDRAEMEYRQASEQYKKALIQQIRSIRKTQAGMPELQRNIDLIDQKISLTEALMKAGQAAELDALKLQNSRNSLKTEYENLRYAIDYQWRNLQYVIHY